MAEQKREDVAVPASDEERGLMERLERAVKAADADYERFLEPEVLLLFVRGLPLGCWKAEALDVSFPKTVDVLTSACEWWKEVGADTIASKTLPRAEEFHKKFNMAVTGYDGPRQILLMHPPEDSLRTSFSQDEFRLLHQQRLAHIFSDKWRRAREVGVTDAQQYKHWCVIDFHGDKGITKTILDWMQLCNTRKGLSIDQWYYPESVNRIFVLNCPMLFRAVWAVAQLFVHPITREKVVLYADAPLADLEKAGLPIASLPKYLGGGAPDPPGLMLTKLVPAGGTEVMRFPVGAAGVGVKYHLLSADDSVSFALSFEASDGTKTEVLPKTAASTFAGLETEGAWEAPGAGSFVVALSSSSWVIGTNVQFSVDASGEVPWFLQGPAYAKPEQTEAQAAASAAAWKVQPQQESA